MNDQLILNFQAGTAYSKLGDMVMRLHPAAQELHAIEEKQVNVTSGFKFKGGWDILLVFGKVVLRNLWDVNMYQWITTFWV